MSDDYDKDYARRTKRRGGGPGGGPTGDYKQTRKPPVKDYNNNYYDNQRYDNKPKDPYNPNKGSYNSQYDDYDSRAGKNDGYSYKPKVHPRRQNQEHGSNSWKKKAAKISKDSILETFVKVRAHSGIDEWVNNYRDLFVKEKQAMMNDEVFQLDPNNGLMPKVNRTGNGPENENEAPPEDNKKESEQTSKGFEMFDFGKDRFDPIQAMRGKNRKEDGGDKKREKEEEETLENEHDVRALESKHPQRGLEERVESRHDENEALGGDDEEFGGEYSNIDEMFAKKMKNNEIPETYEDAFDDLLEVKQKKEKLKQMEDDERPEWEDVDTKEVIEAVKKEDFLASLPQDKTAIFGERGHRKEQNGGFAQSRFTEANKYSAEKPKESDIDFGQFNFDLDMRASPEDFLLKQEDLFPSGLTGKNGPQRPSDNQGMGHPGMTGPMNPGNYPGHVMQQGNMGRPTPQQLQQMQYQQMHPMQQIPPMHQMVHPMHQPEHMGHLNQMNPMNQMRGMGQMNSPDITAQDLNRQYPYGNQGYMGNQLPQYKRNPGEPMNQNFQRPPQPQPQALPSFIFKYFSPVYEEKVWYYIDTQNRVQGPFSGRTMDEWYINGHLPGSLNVTVGKNNGYKTIKDLADIISAPNHNQQNMRGPPPQEPQIPPPIQQGNPGYSGISDLIRNRPDLMQNSPTVPTQQVGVASKPAKTLDEVEQYGPGQQYNQYQKAGYQGSVDQNMAKSNPGYGNQRYPPQMGMAMGERPNSEGPKTEMLAQLQMQNNPHVASAPNGNEGGNPLQGLAALGGGNVDMTAQLKNMLGLGIGGLGGLGGLGGALGGLGGSVGANIGGPAPVETAKPVEDDVNQDSQNAVPKPQEKPQQQLQQQLQQPERVQQQYQEKQQYQDKQQYQEKQAQRQNYNQYNYQEKQQQQQQQQVQAQKKKAAAPKIDTSDFPSLTETYK